MKINKITIAGIIFIILAGILFITDALNPFIRPVTQIFLMGSSKGKDILFFGLFGVFLILSQNISKDVDSQKYLKISIIFGGFILFCGILLEVIFRYQAGIPLNCTFISMKGSMTSTSIIHTHLLKAVFGAVIVKLIGPFIGSSINTGVSLYSFIPGIANFIVLLLPVEFIILNLSNQKRLWPSTILISFFSTCLLIGTLDGGFFGTPAILGFIGLVWVYMNRYYITHYTGVLFKDRKIINLNENNQPFYRNKNLSKKKFLAYRTLVLSLIIIFLLIRIGICMYGSDPTHYTLEIKNPADNIEINNLDIKKINETTYHINSKYNEIDLIKDLKYDLKDKCDYYTLTWNTYSFW